MPHKKKYTTYILRWMLICTIFMTSCVQPTNWEITYDHNGKEPYGTYLFYKALPEYFPSSSILYQKSNTSFEEIPFSEEPRLFIHVGQNIQLTNDESEALKNSITNGATVMLAANSIDTQLLNQLGIKQLEKYGANKFQLSITPFSDSVTIDNPNIETNNIFDMTEVSDSSEIVGYLNNNINAFGYSYGKGSIILCSTPELFTNISMLGNGKKYIEQLLGLINNKQYQQVYFSSYINHNSQVTNISLLWQYPAFRWAIIVLIIGIIVLLLFETKRRQRIIPEIKQQQNNTLDFIATLGLLYYNEKNLNDLGEKKLMYFLEYVRSTYFLDTRNLNQEFFERLKIKSNIPEENIEILAKIIQKIRQKYTLTEADIIALDQNIKLFNDGTK